MFTLILGGDLGRRARVDGLKSFLLCTVHACIQNYRPNSIPGSRLPLAPRRWPMYLVCEYENVDHRLSRRFRLDPHPALPALVVRSVPLTSISISRLLAAPPPHRSILLLFAPRPRPFPQRDTVESESVRESERHTHREREGERDPSRGQTSSSSLCPNLRPRPRPRSPFLLPLALLAFAPRSSSQSLLPTLGWAAAVLYHCFILLDPLFELLLACLHLVAVVLTTSRGPLLPLHPLSLSLTTTS